MVDNLIFFQGQEMLMFFFSTLESLLCIIGTFWRNKKKLLIWFFSRTTNVGVFLFTLKVFLCVIRNPWRETKRNWLITYCPCLHGRPVVFPTMGGLSNLSNHRSVSVWIGDQRFTTWVCDLLVKWTCAPFKKFQSGNHKTTAKASLFCWSSCAQLMISSMKGRSLNFLPMGESFEALMVSVNFCPGSSVKWKILSKAVVWYSECTCCIDLTIRCLESKSHWALESRCQSLESFVRRNLSVHKLI